MSDLVVGLVPRGSEIKEGEHLTSAGNVNGKFLVLNGPIAFLGSSDSSAFSGEEKAHSLALFSNV